LIVPVDALMDNPTGVELKVPPGVPEIVGVGLVPVWQNVEGE
jgi:hypothetical protein